MKSNEIKRTTGQENGDNQSSGTFEDSVYSATFPTNIRDTFPFNTTAQQTHFTNPDS